jgi:hypothetical protein
VDAQATPGCTLGMAVVVDRCWDWQGGGVRRRAAVSRAVIGYWV